MIKAIIMDMDGTLTKFNLDYMKARQQALKELERMKLRTPDMTELISIYLVLKKLKPSLDTKSFTELQKKFYTILEEMEIKAAQDAILYPGALDTLRKLRAQGLKIGVVTNNGRKGTELTLKRCQLESFFNAVATRDDCAEMKPDAGPVLKVLQEMHVSSEETILVGDGVQDILAARAAGIPSVAVATGPFTSQRLLETEPDYLLGSINDLPMLIEALATHA